MKLLIATIILAIIFYCIPMGIILYAVYLRKKYAVLYDNAEKELAKYGINNTEHTYKFEYVYNGEPREDLFKLIDMSIPNILSNNTHIKDTDTVININGVKKIKNTNKLVELKYIVTSNKDGFIKHSVKTINEFIDIIVNYNVQIQDVTELHQKEKTHKINLV